MADDPMPRAQRTAPRPGVETKAAFAARHGQALADAEAAGLIRVVWRRNGGHHVRLVVVATGRQYDCWPVNGRWSEVNSPYRTRTGGIAALLREETHDG